VRVTKLKDNEKLDYVGVCHEIEPIGTIWLPKNSTNGAGALFIPEFGKKLDYARAMLAIRALLVSIEGEIYEP
jgi:hypothetical protein